jgi:hypothetical protein
MVAEMRKQQGVTGNTFFLVLTRRKYRREHCAADERRGVNAA